MNKSKQLLNNKLSKKIQKEVRKAQKEYLRREEPTDSDPVTAEEMLKRFPKKTAKKEKALLASLQKQMKIKKGCKKKILSKRTNPGEVLAHSAPAHVHKEGSHWVKTLTQQNKEKRKLLEKKLSKR